MANLQVIVGEGTFEKDGQMVHYPIKKLIVINEENNAVEIKLDKTSYLLLTYLFDFVSEGTTEDSNGVQCSLFLLKEKSSVDIKS